MVSRRSFVANMLLACGAFVNTPLIAGGLVHASVSTSPISKDCCLWACWLGHSTVLLNVGGLWIITDPVLYNTYGITALGTTFGPRRAVPPAMSVGEIPKPDVVLLSHAHLDHMDRPTLEALTRRWPGELSVITAMNTSDVISDMPWKQVMEMDWGDTTEFRSAAITALRVEHNGWRMPGDACRSRGQLKSGRSYNGYLIDVEGIRIVFGGDTAYCKHFSTIGSPVDLAIMPIGAYGGYADMHCTPEEALEMSAMMKAPWMLPIHYGTFKQGNEHFREPMYRLRSALSRQNIRLAITQHGGIHQVNRT